MQCVRGHKGTSWPLIKHRKIVRHAKKCMNIRIKQDRVLSGTIDHLIVSYTVRIMFEYIRQL